MPCPKTDSFLYQYFTADSATRAKLLKEPHFSQCKYCSEQLSEMLATESNLSAWEDVKVPSWNSKDILNNGKSRFPKFLGSMDTNGRLSGNVLRGGFQSSNNRLW